MCNRHRGKFTSTQVWIWLPPCPTVNSCLFVSFASSYVQASLGLLLLLFWDRVSLCSPDWLTGNSYRQGLPQTQRSACLPNAGIKGMHHHIWRINFWIKINLRLGLVAHAFNPSTGEEKAGGFLWVQGQPGLQREFQVSWGYRETLSQTHQRTEKKRKSLTWSWWGSSAAKWFKVLWVVLRLVLPVAPAGLELTL